MARHSTSQGSSSAWRSTVPRWLFRLGIAASLMIVLMTAPFTDPAAAQGWLPEKERIPLDLSGELLTLDGNPVHISDYDEKVLVLNFWATWCGPCLAEMPSLDELQAKFEGRSLRILAITDEDIDTVRSFEERHPSHLTVLVDKGGRLSERLRIWSIPWTLVLDSHRRLIHFQVGAVRWDSPGIVQQLERQLGE